MHGVLASERYGVGSFLYPSWRRDTKGNARSTVYPALKKPEMALFTEAKGIWRRGQKTTRALRFRRSAPVRVLNLVLA
jgi:hypothetical protein